MTKSSDVGRSAEGVCVGGRVFVGGRSFADRQFLVLSFVVFNCLDMYPFVIGHSYISVRLSPRRAKHYSNFFLLLMRPHIYATIVYHFM